MNSISNLRSSHYGLKYGSPLPVSTMSSPVETLAGALDPRGLTTKDLNALSENSFLVYTCFLMLGSLLYYGLDGSLSEMGMRDLLGLLSTIAEAFGLLFLRWKIQSQQSVAGISGMSMIMYGLYYLYRSVELPPCSLEFLDAWVVKVLEHASFLLVMDVIRSVFRSYRKTYQAELDVVRVPYLCVGAMLVSLVIRSTEDSFFWSATMYMDTVALMPQVVMMARSETGTVEAPISHFVAATAFSRGVDLYYWCWSFHAQGGMNYSAWVILSVHVIYQLLVADFIYLYLKQRLALRSLSEDLTLPDGDNII